MRSTQVIVKVKQLEPSLREQGIGAIYLFGSVARETQTDSMWVKTSIYSVVSR